MIIVSIKHNKVLNLTWIYKNYSYYQLLISVILARILVYTLYIIIIK